MKNNKGITLIALVITIIVLLILAGVAIAMLTGENSILTRSTDTKYATEIGKAKDEIGLKVNEYAMAYFEEKYVAESTTYTDLNDAIVKQLKANESSLTDADVNVTVNDTTKTITVEAAKKDAIKTVGTFTGKNGGLVWKDSFNSTITVEP